MPKSIPNPIRITANETLRMFRCPTAKVVNPKLQARPTASTNRASTGCLTPRNPMSSSKPTAANATAPAFSMSARPRRTSSISSAGMPVTEAVTAPRSLATAAAIARNRSSTASGEATPSDVRAGATRISPSVPASFRK